MMDILEDLAKWFAAHCDGEWEHTSGVKIDSCDNPGRWVKIDLVGTELEGRRFESVLRGDVVGNTDPQPPWLHCYTENGVWNGAGDSSTLAEILATFLSWAKGV
jgi:hypothetical protein